jgi:hypothetical protein
VSRRYLHPDQSQSLLIALVLGPRARAEELFEKWRQTADFERDIDPATYRMLPSVYVRLRDAGFAGPEMARLRGIYRHSWCEGQTRLRHAQGIVGLFARNGLPVMIGKGMALVAGGYLSAAERPMSDLDLYVQETDLETALALLSQHGWTIGDPRANRDLRDLQVLYPAVTLWHPEFGELDLHWRLMSGVMSQRVIARFWRSAEAVRFGTAEVLVPAPAFLLLHVVVHGALSNRLAPMRWIMDAAAIVRREGERIDWDDLGQFARTNLLGDRLARGLQQLGEVIDWSVPSAIAQSKPSSIETIERKAVLENTGERQVPLYGLICLGIFVAKMLREDDRRHFPRLAWRSLRRRFA